VNYSFNWRHNIYQDWLKNDTLLYKGSLMVLWHLCRAVQLINCIVKV